MDGHGKPKLHKYKGELYSETRFSAIQFLQRELPKLSGRVINVSAGNWKVPEQLIDRKRVTEYITFDKKLFGDSKNRVQVVGDVVKMPFADEYADAIVNNQSLQNYSDPFKACSEMHRVLKKGGTLLLDVGFNTSFHGYGSTPGSLKKKNKVFDYFRFTQQGLELLLKDFSKVDVTHSGPNSWSPHCYFVKAVR